MFLNLTRLSVLIGYMLIAQDSVAQDKKTENPSKAKQDAAKHKLLVKKMMIAVHRGPHAPVATFDEELKKTKPDWKKLGKSAEFVETMSMVVSANRNKSAYKMHSSQMIDGIRKRDLELARMGFTSFKTSCASCHGWAGKYDLLRQEKKKEHVKKR